ncbi:Chibby 1 [Fasciola gigantica]|uniref:Chibby 1 n=1 Tax=Fasciola gigantica TaxID=46835 RepID=A0A504YAU4_FASGI|nr:Chibby 1 [Fasciola gigantica]
MPLFSRKFSVPKFPARKAASMTNLSQLDATTRSQEFSLDFGPVRTRLSGRDLVFRDGNWIIEGGDTLMQSANANRESFRIKKENHQLTEENNLLKLKIDILLDMLAETTAEVHLQENEIENLRSMLNKKPMPNIIQVS